VSFAAITLCVASQGVFIFRYRLSPFGYTLIGAVRHLCVKTMITLFPLNGTHYHYTGPIMGPETFDTLKCPSTNSWRNRFMRQVSSYLQVPHSKELLHEDGVSPQSTESCILRKQGEKYTLTLINAWGRLHLTKPTVTQLIEKKKNPGRFIIRVLHWTVSSARWF